MSKCNFVRRSFMIATAALLTAPAFGQTIKTIQIGQTQAGTAASGIDLYRVGGPSGTELTFDLTAAGSSGLVFYTPDGEEMLTETGTGKVRLSVVLPLDDVFILGVIGNGKAYSLKLAGVEPDSHLAAFAAWVGYRHEGADGIQTTQCWMDPGRTLRLTRSNGDVIVSTIGRGGKTYHEGMNGEQHAVWEDVRSIEGDEIIRTRSQGGQSHVVRSPIKERTKPNGGFVRYFCA